MPPAISGAALYNRELQAYCTLANHICLPSRAESRALVFVAAGGSQDMGMRGVVRSGTASRIASATPYTQRLEHSRTSERASSMISAVARRQRCAASGLEASRCMAGRPPSARPTPAKAFSVVPPSALAARPAPPPPRQHVTCVH